tara:strand:+ start:154 stop:453 length:300 start_codon:yes stop_codon:yes gene_type:complete
MWEDILKELSSKQKKIDLNFNGEIDGEDFKLLGARKESLKKGTFSFFLRVECDADIPERELHRQIADRLQEELKGMEVDFPVDGDEDHTFTITDVGENR